MKTKVITIREDQEEWLKKDYVKLSAFVQDMLDREIERRRRGERDEEKE